ncbi:uncharacterized protein [Typha angustifolia]|uniref:uncharacterized protein n=1 Tax=Typha angustifolia TaxID=59011 RepID=UPI003C2EF516
MEKKPLLASHKERLSTRLWRWLKTLFFLLTMLASLLVVCAPPLLIVVLDLLLPPALLSTFLRHSPTFPVPSLCDQLHNFDIRSSLIDLPLISVARSLLILCAYVVCDGRGAYLGITVICSLASVGYVSVKGVSMSGTEGVRRILAEGKDGLVVIEALFLSSVALAVAHVVVAYRTSCRERRKLLVYRIDIEAVKLKSGQAKGGKQMAS